MAKCFELESWQGYVERSRNTTGRNAISCTRTVRVIKTAEYLAKQIAIVLFFSYLLRVVQHVVIMKRVMVAVLLVSGAKNVARQTAPAVGWPVRHQRSRRQFVGQSVMTDRQRVPPTVVDIIAGAAH